MPSKTEARPFGSLLAALVAIVAFSAECFFFALAGGGSSVQRLAGGLIWALFCASLFAVIAIRGRPGKARTLFFSAAALAFIPSFIAQLVEARGHMAVTEAEVIASQVPFCHIAITTSVLPAALFRTLDFPAQLVGARAAFYPMLVYWILSLVTVGRGWCGWVCFYGGLEDGISSLAGKSRLNLQGKGPGFRRINLAVLAFVALAGLATLSIVYCDWLCPFKLVTEYAAPTGARTYVALILFIGLFLALVVVLPSLSRKRTQCSILCPFGALQSLLDRISPFRVAVNTSSCISCGACDKACPMLAIDAESRAGGGTHSTCVKCGRCFEVCPKKALGFKSRLQKDGDAYLRCFVESLMRGGREPDRPGFLRRIAAGMLDILAALLSPSLLFPFTAMSFGMIISTGFSAQTVARLVALITTGSFSLGGLQ